MSVSNRLAAVESAGVDPHQQCSESAAGQLESLRTVCNSNTKSTSSRIRDDSTRTPSCLCCTAATCSSVRVFTQGRGAHPPQKGGLAKLQDARDAAEHDRTLRVVRHVLYEPRGKRQHRRDEARRERARQPCSTNARALGGVASSPARPLAVPAMMSWPETR